jgi:hypothetical protein
VIQACSDLICARVGGDTTALYRTKGAAQERSEKAMKGWLEKKEETDDDAFIRIEAENITKGKER